jgi:glycosyltransferase involved in cell wall biosynthesis
MNGPGAGTRMRVLERCALPQVAALLGSPAVPELSVLLPVRNAGPYLEASLASLWRQNFRDFEVVAVDDGSSDDSGEALERAAAREPRLRVLRQPPRGLPAALNLALAHAHGSLVARHDADDLSHRCRFELQVDYLRSDPRTDVVGSRLRLFPTARIGPGMRRWAAWHNRLLTHPAMAREMLIDSPLAHGTAMMRRSRLERVGGWAERPWPEDLDLWLRLLDSEARFAKLPRVLYAWRRHPGSATVCQPRYGRERFDALRLRVLRRGLLRGARRVTLVGVGSSLERWGGILRGAGFQPGAVPAGRPPAARAPLFRPPVLLVFGAAAARERWREWLIGAGLTEGRHFLFVA